MHEFCCFPYYLNVKLQNRKGDVFMVQSVHINSGYNTNILSTVVDNNRPRIMGGLVLYKVGLLQSDIYQHSASDEFLADLPLVPSRPADYPSASIQPDSWPTSVPLQCRYRPIWPPVFPFHCRHIGVIQPRCPSCTVNKYICNKTDYRSKVDDPQMCL